MCDQLDAYPLTRLFIFASVLYGISAVGSTLYNMYIEPNKSRARSYSRRIAYPEI